MDISTINNIKYGIYPLGVMVRGTLCDEFIYRIRPGNNYFGSIEGRLYQDKYAYFVPSSINNPESEPYRVQFKATIKYWQTVLSLEEQEEYNQRANIIRGLSGYNLFIREAMKGIYEMYVNREDLSDYDFDENDLNNDGNWHTLDLSSIITVQARIILCKITIDCDATNKYFIIRRKGETGTFNSTEMELVVPNNATHFERHVVPGENREIEYKIHADIWPTRKLTILGWWT